MLLQNVKKPFEVREVAPDMKWHGMDIWEIGKTLTFEVNYTKRTVLWNIKKL